MQSLMDQRNILLDKKLVPDHTLGIFDIGNMKKALFDVNHDPVKERVCPECGIRIKGPNEWFRHHLKTHFEKRIDQEKIREGDSNKIESKVYFD